MARKHAADKSADAKPNKPKLVRDSFTMPKDDYALIDSLKAKAVDAKRPAKKSELLRAGLRALDALNAAELKRVLDALAPVKTGRPKAEPAVEAAVAPVAPAPAPKVAARKPVKAAAKAPAPARTAPRKAPAKALAKAPAKAPARSPVKAPVKTARRRSA